MQNGRNEAIVQAKKLNQESVTKFKKAEYKAAIEIAFKAVKILEDNQAETTDIAICYYNIGSSYLRLFETLPSILRGTLNCEQALGYAFRGINKAIELYKSVDSTEGVHKAQNKLDLCYQYQLQSKYTDKQIAIFSRHELKPLQVAIMLGDFDRFEEVYKNNPACLKEIDSFGWPPILYALYFKTNLKIVLFLIEANKEYLTSNYFPFNGISSSKGLLDKYEQYPPIYFALVHPPFTENLRVGWGMEGLINVLEKLIESEPQQLDIVKGLEGRDEQCALDKAISESMPESIVKLLLKHTHESVFGQSKALHIALKLSVKNVISGYENILEEFIEKTSGKAFENPELLELALKAKYNDSLIKEIFNKNPAIVQSFKESPLLFLAIYHRASFEIFKLFYEANLEAALQLGGSSLLSGWEGDDSGDEWINSPNVTSLMLALNQNCFEIADFLLQERPVLANMKNEKDELPFDYINWADVPLKTVENLLKLGWLAFYKEKNIVHFANMLLEKQRADLVNLIFRLGLAVGQSFTGTLNNIDTKNCIVIGMSINETLVSRAMPGFEESITNIGELHHAQNAGMILKANDEFNHYIQLIQSILFSENAHNRTMNIAPLTKLQNWLLVNKPEQSLVAYCFNFMLNKDKYNSQQLDQAKKQLPKDLTEKLNLTI